MRSLKIVALLVVAGVATALAAEKPLAEPDGRDEWAKADTAVATLMKEADAAARSAVFASALLRKYLPGYRVYVRMADSYGKETRIFLATRDGAVTPLPDAQWRKRDDEPFWRSPVISEFLRKRQIKVRNGEEAVEVARLFEELEAAANYVAFFKINTKDFTVFDSSSSSSNSDQGFIGSTRLSRVEARAGRSRSICRTTGVDPAATGVRDRSRRAAYLPGSPMEVMRALVVATLFAFLPGLVQGADASPRYRMEVITGCGCDSSRRDGGRALRPGRHGLQNFARFAAVRRFPASRRNTRMVAGMHSQERWCRGIARFD
jgi:hypothetical protein